MLKDGKIHTFLDIFNYIPKSVVAADLGKKTVHFTKLMNRVDQFTLEELFLIANFCNLSTDEILSLVNKEYLKNKDKIEKSISPS
jgi:hypothetical protein